MMWLPMHRRPSFACRSRRPSKPAADDDLSSFFLTVPKTDRLDPENRVLGDLEIGHAAMQGLRVHFEDKHIIASCKSLPDHIFLAVFDGHSGTLTAEHASQHMVETLEATVQWKKYVKLSAADKTKSQDLLSQALVQTFVDFDANLRELLRPNGVSINESGAAAVCTLITPTHIFCANLGDSRCVLGTRDEVVSMSDDHKPELPQEEERIKAAGGFVMWNRVNGQLAMSRALGDFVYKENESLSSSQQLVIAYPDVAVRARNPTRDEVIVLACDGVWDVMSNDEAISFATAKLQADASLTAQGCAEALIDWALERDSSDNISAIVAKLPALHAAPEDAPAAKKARR